MSRQLRADLEELDAYVTRIAEATGIPASHVEKDYWVTEVLRGASAASRELGCSVVFKGGTSLSKAHHLIQRFSEDVDLIAVLPAGGTKAKDTALKAFVENAESIGMPIDFDEAEPVSILVLEPVRTLVDKLVLLHHAATEGDDTRKEATARHYYDVDRLLRNDDVLAQLREPPIDVLAREVCEHSHAAELPTADRPRGGFATSPAWDPAVARVAGAAYETAVLPNLVWPGAPRSTFEECCARVHAHGTASEVVSLRPTQHVGHGRRGRTRTGQREQEPHKRTLSEKPRAIHVHLPISAPVRSTPAARKPPPIRGFSWWA